MYQLPECFALFIIMMNCSYCSGNEASLAVKSERAAQSVRLVDAHGLSGSVGLLQVRTSHANPSEFGSVCGMNMAAADVVCAQLGYDFGSVSTSPCGNYGGANLCGAINSAVAMSDLKCEGGELDIHECAFTSPDATCLSHDYDSIVFCGFEDTVRFQEGSVRLLSYDGSPSIDGVGRLEVFHASSWGPVCTSGFTLGAANVACKAMGFDGAHSSGDPFSCGDYAGKNFCGILAPQLSELACSGQEDALLSCPYDDLDDVFCASEESVLLRCNGVGDTQGRAGKVSAAQASAAV